MTYSLRRLLPSDAGSCLQILLDLRAFGNLNMHMWSLQSFKSEFEHGGGFGIFVEGRLKAFLFFRYSPDWLEVSNLATDPWYQGRGLMTQLMQHLLQTAVLISKSAKSIKLEVHQQNIAALGVYKRSGFTIDGLRKNYYGHGAHAVLMSRALHTHKIVEIEHSLV
jgi:ribosomal-protein-alanine N-acetyltransferase